MNTTTILAAIALCAHFACAQVILEPKPRELTKPTEWRTHPLAKVGKSQDWLVSIRFRMTSREPQHEVNSHYCCADPAKIKRLNDPKGPLELRCESGTQYDPEWPPRRYRISLARL